jgi:hypothetical protein
MRDYDRNELRALDRTAQLVFARDDDHRMMPAAPGAASPATPRVRHHDTLLTFNVYPRSDRDVARNELLWRVVRDSSFLSAELDPHLARTPMQPDHNTPNMGVAVVFALAIPLKLVHFLEVVTLDEMHNSVIHMLADAAQGEDEDGLQLMREELSPTIWSRLEPVLLEESACCCVSRPAQPPPSSSTPPAGDRSPCARQGVMCNKFASGMLDMALQSSHAQNYWSVDIQGTWFEICPPPQQQHGDTQSEKNPNNQTTHNNDRAAITHSLYLDWRVYARTCMVMDTQRSNGWTASADHQHSWWPDNYEMMPRWTSGNSPPETAVKCRLILDTLLQLVSEQRQAATWERAETLLLCASRRGNELHTLPEHLIHQEIIPRVILEDPVLLEDSRDAQHELTVVTSPALDIVPGACLPTRPMLLPMILDDEEMHTDNNLSDLGLVLDDFDDR